MNDSHVGWVAQRLALHEATAPLAVEWLIGGENAQGDGAAKRVVASPYVKDRAAELLRDSPQGAMAYTLAAGLAAVPEYRVLSIEWLESNASDPNAWVVAHELAGERSGSEAAFRWLLGTSDVMSASLVFGELLDYDWMHDDLFKWADSIGQPSMAHRVFTTLAEFPSRLSQVTAWVERNWDYEFTPYIIGQIAHADTATRLMERWLAEHPDTESAEYCDIWFRAQESARTRRGPVSSS